MKLKVKLLCRVRLFETPWTAAHQAPLSMGFFQARALEWVAIASSTRATPHEKAILVLIFLLKLLSYLFFKIKIIDAKHKIS